ncbi:MAG: hypothetical protein M9962_03965 [Oligoflexia bacterium]|nr:hypothetical protein [Oligoflexia bacterium]
MKFLNKQAIIMLIGATAYGLLGLIVIKELNLPLSRGVGYFSLMMLSICVVLSMSTLRLKQSYFSLWLFIICQLTLGNTFFYFPLFGGEGHIICCIVMLIAVVDCGVLMPTRLMTMNHIFSAMQTSILIFWIPDFQNMLIIGPVGLLLIWKFVVNLGWQKMSYENVKNRQLEAFRATVVTLSHEFNNVVAICDILLKSILEKKESSVVLSGEKLNTLERNLKRIVGLIKKLRQAKKYEEVQYLGRIAMLHMDVDESEK